MFSQVLKHSSSPHLKKPQQSFLQCGVAVVTNFSAVSSTRVATFFWYVGTAWKIILSDFANPLNTSNGGHCSIIFTIRSRKLNTTVTHCPMFTPERIAKRWATREE